MRSRRPLRGSLACALACVTLVLAAVGCGRGQHTLVGQGREIDEVRFEGTSHLSKAQILDHLRAGETSWIPFTPSYPYDEGLLDADVERIERLYEAHGHYDARVVGRTVEIDDDEVVLTIRIDEGLPTTIDRVTVQWADDGAPSAELRAEVERVVGLAAGDVFEVPRLNEAIGALREELHVRGHPLAVAQGHADVRTDTRKAAVVLEVAAGPWARIGSIRVEGLYGVPEYAVQREVRFAVGQPYSPATVQQVGQALNAMRVFGWVAPAPVGEVKDGAMELVMLVSEANPQSIKLGALVDLQSARWQQLGSATYTHTNLTGHLTRLDLELVAGYAELPDFLDVDQAGPVISVSPAFSHKGLFEDGLLWELEPRWRMDIREGYQFREASGRLGVSRWFAGAFRAGLSHNVQHVDFFNLQPTFDAGTSLLGLDFRDPFVVSFFEVKLGLFLADSIVSPTNGVILETTYDLAGGPFLGDYDHHKLEGFLRGYWRPFSRLQVAARAGAGFFLTYGPQAGVPINFKYYLGGANSVRGWGSRRLSPRLGACDDQGDDCDQTPVGGLSMVQGNFELRLRTFGALHLVGFADAGDNQAAEQALVVSEWNYAAGPGLRYDSPIGVVRLDVGFRLNDPGVYDEPPWGLYFGFGETF